MSEERVCFYCLDKATGGICVCLGCRTKLEIAKRDLESAKRSMSRERALFFRLSKENQRLRAYIVKLEAASERQKR